MKKVFKIIIPFITILCLVLCSTFTVFASDENVESQLTLYKATQSNLLNTNEIANNFNIVNVMNSYAYTPTIWNYQNNIALNSLTLQGDVFTNETSSIVIIYEISNDIGIDYVQEAMQASLYTGTQYHTVRYINAHSLNYNGTIISPKETISGMISDLPSEQREKIQIYSEINFITEQLNVVTFTSAQVNNEWYQSTYSVPLKKSDSNAGESVRFQMNLPELTTQSAPKNVRFTRAEVYRNEYPEGIKQSIINAYNEGYTNGYNNGYQVGDYSGYNVGYAQGKQEGSDEGYEAGYQNGYNRGKFDGKASGYTEGYQAGLSADSNESYEQGFQDGVREATVGHENVSAITVLFNGITSTVQGVLNTLFDVQIGNLTLGWVVGVLLGAVVVYFVIKVVIR